MARTVKKSKKKTIRKKVVKKKGKTLLERKFEQIDHGHENRVLLLSSALITALHKNKLPKNSENVKAIGYFLVGIGESFSKGSLKKARKIRLEAAPSDPLISDDLGVSFCLVGDTIMDWAAGIVLREKK